MTRLVLWFPLWAILASTVAFFWPDFFTGLKPWIVPLLGLVMFGMGITLRVEDFAAVLRRPRLLLGGVGLQYGLMPLAGWGIGSVLGLPPELLIGFVLLGASPGGTASNLVCYLARGDLALSITLTTLSTLFAVVLTPGLTWLYVGQSVPVPAADMLISIAKIILAPVILGLIARRLLGSRLRPVERIFPLLSMLAIVSIIAIVVALNRSNLQQLGLAVAIAVILHNGVGLMGGYWFARLLGQDEARARTLAIEVGMQNSGLAVALAVKYFSATAALPGALFSIWHNLSGAGLAAWWSRRSY